MHLFSYLLRGIIYRYGISGAIPWINLNMEYFSLSHSLPNVFMITNRFECGLHQSLILLHCNGIRIRANFNIVPVQLTYGAYTICYGLVYV